MKQSRLMSLIEQTTSTLAGFGISLTAQWFFLPLIGVAIRFEQNLVFALIMTVISVGRGFVLRRAFEALHIRRPLSPFMHAVIAERFRQVEAEGWDAAHDDAHGRGELARAGAAYATFACEDFPTPLVRWSRDLWPWEREWFKPTGFRRDLVKGAALILAEGEKFDRARRKSAETPA